MSKFLPTIMATALVLATGSFCLAEQIDNAAYKSWAKHQPGTSITVVTESDVGMKMTTEMTTTLLEVTPEKVVTETRSVMTMQGQKLEGLPLKLDIPAKIEKPAETAPATSPDASTTTEEIDVAGKKVKCVIVETKTTANGTDSVMKLWNSDEVPGMMVKSVRTLTGSSKGTEKNTLTAMTIR